MKAIIFHGSYGSPDENWIPWLKKHLETQGCKVFAPNFPTPKNQSLKNWNSVFEKIEKEINPESVFVGHSLGVAFALRLLEKLDVKVKACFFVAGFVGLLGDSKFDEINKTFVEAPFNWEKIRSNCDSFTVLQSDNDPFVPIENAEEIARGLGVEVELVKNAGHFNASAGYKEFPLLLEKISGEQNSKI